MSKNNFTRLTALVFSILLSTAVNAQPGQDRGGNPFDQINALELQVATLAELTTTLQERIAELEAAAKALAEEDLKAKQELAKQKYELNKEIQAKADLLDQKLEAEKRILDDKLLATKTDFETKTGDIDLVTKDLEDKTTSIQTKTSELESKTETIDESTKQLAETVKKTTTDLADKTTIIETKTDELEKSLETLEYKNTAAVAGTKYLVQYNFTGLTGGAEGIVQSGSGGHLYTFNSDGSGTRQFAECASGAIHGLPERADHYNSLSCGSPNQFAISWSQSDNIVTVIFAGSTQRRFEYYVSDDGSTMVALPNITGSETNYRQILHVAVRVSG